MEWDEVVDVIVVESIAHLEMQLPREWMGKHRWNVLWLENHLTDEIENAFCSTAIVVDMNYKDYMNYTMARESRVEDHMGDRNGFLTHRLSKNSETPFHFQPL